MCCNDTQPAPDYSGIASANAESARYAKEAADRDFAYRVAQDARNQPRIDRAFDLSERISESQLTDAGIARERSAEAYGDWQKLGRPLQERVVNEANAYGGEADQAMQAGRAVADVNAQGANAREQGLRSMAAMGVNPNSGRFAAMSRGADLSQAAMAAGAATNARVAARDKGMALRAGALSGMTGQQNVAGQNMGLATAAGNSATGNMNAGVNNGLGWANFATGGTGNAINAANLGVQSQLGLGSLMNSGYQIQSANANQPSGLGQLAGMAVGGMMGNPGLGAAAGKYLFGR